MEGVDGCHGESGIFFLGEGRNKWVWDLLCGDIDPNTGLTYIGFVPIAPPDYPSRKDYSEFGYTWVLLQELIDYPWEMRQRHFQAYFDAGNFRAYLDGAKFRSFPVVPPRLESPIQYPRPEWLIVSQEQMLELAVSGRSPSNCYTKIE